MTQQRPAMRDHRVEVYSPRGRWVWGQWVTLEGTGPYVDRLERAALDTLASEPAGSQAKAYRYASHSIDPMTLVMTVTLPVPAWLDPSQASELSCEWEDRPRGRQDDGSEPELHGEVDPGRGEQCEARG